MTRRGFVASAAVGAMSAHAAGRYRVVLIGHTGRGDFGHDWDLSWNSVPNAEVVAVADPDEAGRGRAMKRSRAAKGYADYRLMIEREKPDIVTICPRWMDQRVEMVTAAATARAHILMEKPFASTLGDADRMIEAVERSGIRVQVGHTARPMAVVRKVRSMLLDGELGVLQEMRARGKEDRRAGGEDLMVLGTHTFDLLRYFAGDPGWVFAHVSDGGREVRLGMERDASEPVGKIAGDQVAAMFSFANGVHGYFGTKSSDVRDGQRFGVTVYGSRATVFVPLSDVPSAAPYLLRSPMWVDGKWERIEYPADAPVMTRERTNAAMAIDLLSAIEEKRDPVCSARDGRWTVEMVAGIYQSQLSGSRVNFLLVKREVWPSNQ